MSNFQVAEEPKKVKKEIDATPPPSAKNIVSEMIEDEQESEVESEVDNVIDNDEAEIQGTEDAEIIEDIPVSFGKNHSPNFWVFSLLPKMPNQKIIQLIQNLKRKSLPKMSRKKKLPNQKVTFALLRTRLSSSKTCLSMQQSSS